MFLEYPAVPTVALIGTQIVLTCRVTTEYRVAWIVEIPGIGRFDSDDPAAVAALRDEGFVTSIQNRENPLTITGSFRTNQATVQCAAVNVSNIFMRFVLETLITVQFFSKLKA